MGTGSWQSGIAALLLTAWLALSGTAGAQGPLAPPRAVGVDLPRSGGECCEERERALLGPRGCIQEPVTLPTWLGPLPDPVRTTPGSVGEEGALDVVKQLQSPGYLHRLEAEKTRLGREVFGQVLEAFPDVSGPGRSPSRGLPPTDRIYLFISESVPLETLRNYARDVVEIGDPRIVMVLRGFVGGMRHVLPTRRFVLDVLRKDFACDPEARSDCDLYPANLVIDPLLFRRYDVQEVPTVVYAQGVQSAPPGTERGPAVIAGGERFWRLSGDAGLDALLRRINQDAKSPALTSTVLDLGR
ncbi:MAG: type-F conjugative transfer system pilin assembly protein TrbC [Deferrisomatales bacterium]|nr:type-F conjugative transfer system pilin assembly protein TrbC [Deferrisomatales bacterium]